MYYEFLVTHLDAPFLLLSAVTTGLIIRIFYNAYMKLKLAMRILTSVVFFIKRHYGRPWHRLLL